MKTIIYFASIICLYQAVIFDCQFSIIYWPLLDAVYECRPFVVASASGSVLENVTGSHRLYKSNVDVEFLYIKEQDLTYVPNNIETFFPNLKGIVYSYSNLTSFCRRFETISTAGSILRE